ncbi:ABC transporter permease [Arthrobacter cryoconiti]|uniref:ABC transporter permease n=1 Tax=Arthrobacter cryoconiti TaxID=748907 RepID=A0ABV8R3B7_9MICC|nr:ABC transporter permease [Arthrobacter cryoconiti]MCC9069887.1 ABC transporter permease [Arthrobacter cryoconiti]
MNRWTAVIAHELLCTMRERLPQVLLAVFVGMVAASAFIGSSARASVTGVYSEAVRQGLTTVPNPFDSLSPLYYARNSVIYIVLIGALLAIVVGVYSTLRDRQARTMDLVLSRDVRPSFYLSAKLAGLGLFTALLLAVSAVISIACISVVAGRIISVDDGARLVGLYAVAWLFILPFLCLGMLAGLYATSVTSALLIPIVVWSVTIFILPLLGTAAHPVSLLNPVASPPAIQSGFFAVTSNLVNPLSLGEHFKHAGALILADPQATGTVTTSIWTILAFAIAACVAVIMTRRGRMRSALHD